MPEDKKIRGRRLSLCARAALCIVLCLSMLNIPLKTRSAVTIPTGASMYQQVKDTYNDCITMDRSRYGLGRLVSGRWMFGCAHLVNMKLILMGVNNRYVGANGNDEYDNYKNLGYDRTHQLYNGKYKVHVYPAGQYTVGSALEAIKKECRIATNIVVGFQKTMDTAGQIYGHAFYIEGLINDNIYFTENFTIAYYSEMYFQAGDPVVMTISQCQAYYGRSWFTFEGTIWFEDPALTAAVKSGGTYDPGDDDPGFITNVADAGTYTVVNAGTNGLNLRNGPGTNYTSFGRVPNGSTLYVTGTCDGFAKVFFSDDMYALDGWVSVSYLRKKSAMPKVLADFYDADGYHLARRGYADLSEALNGVPLGEVTVMTLYGDVTVDNDLTVPEGVTVDSNKHSIKVASTGSITVRGGTLMTKDKLDALSSDPFTLSEQSGDQNIYRCYFGLKLTGASLGIADKTAVNFTVSYTRQMMPVNSSAEYKLICENAAGEKKTYYAKPGAASSDGIADGDYLTFITDPMAAKFLSDSISCRAEITVTAGGKKYAFESDELVYSPTEYCMSARGDDLKLGRFLDEMMHYSAECQKFFGYSTDNLADRGIEKADPASNEEIVKIALKQNAPGYSEGKTSVHLSSVRLAFGDSVCIVARSADKLPAGTKLLVWSASDYKKLTGSVAGNTDVGDKLTSGNATYTLSPDAQGCFTLPGAAPKQFADTVYFRLAVPSGSSYIYDSVMSYSVTAYCSAMLSNGVNDPADALCLALCRYCAAARDYYGYTPNS